MEIPKISIIAFAVAIGMVISACLMLIKGKSIDGVVRMRSGLIFSSVIEILVFIGLAVFAFSDDELRKIWPAFIILALMPLLPMLLAVGYRITYDSVGFEYRISFKKPQRYSYSEITELIESSQNVKVRSISMNVGKRRISVSEMNSGGKEFMEIVKQKYALYHGQTK